jgi:NADPH:quinone reductase-like Zn-dependent oxidoreductase
MKYRSVVATRLGGPEVLHVIENDLQDPIADEVRIRVLASAVSRPDITVRTGEALYAGTPLGKKPPFVPGYAVIGDVEAVGEGVTNIAVGDRVGVMTVTGGYTEYLYWCSNHVVPVPASLDPGEAVTLILNYIVAYQTLHRSARIESGEKSLVIGACGGVGTALLELGRLAGVTMYGLASKSKHDSLTRLGAIPVDYHDPDWVNVLREAVPGGFDAVFDGMSGPYIDLGISLLRRGGRLISFGEPESLLPVLAKFVQYNLQPNGKTLKLYGTSRYALFDRSPYLEDLAMLFRMLEEGQIRPLIQQRFAILEAAKANALLESGQVTGNVVLLAPELLRV